MNFARDVVDATPPGQRALVELDRNGNRRESTFGEIAYGAARLAGGLRRGGTMAAPSHCSWEDRRRQPTLTL